MSQMKPSPPTMAQVFETQEAGMLDSNHWTHTERIDPLPLGREWCGWAIYSLDVIRTLRQARENWLDRAFRRIWGDR